MKTLLALFLTLASFTVAHASVDVASLATGGSGTVTSPWTGWEPTTVTASTEYYFKKGVYAYTVSPNWLKDNVAVICEAGAELAYSGTGDAVIFSNPGDGSGVSWNIFPRFENCSVSGGRNGLVIRGVINGSFRNLHFTGYTNAGIITGGSLITEIKNVRTEGGRFGLVIGERGAEDINPLSIGSPYASPQFTTTFTIASIETRGSSVAGIYIRAGSYGSTFTSSTSEANYGRGLYVDGSMNTFDHLDMEYNGGTDAEIHGVSNKLKNCTSDNLVYLAAGQRHEINGGQFHDITVHPYVDFATVTMVSYGGTFVKSSSTYDFANMGPGFFRYQSTMGYVLTPATQLGDAPSVVTDVSKAGYFYMALFQNVTLAPPANAVNGQTVRWHIVQSTGNYTLSFSNGFIAPPGRMLPSMPTAHGSFVDVVATYSQWSNAWVVENAPPKAGQAVLISGTKSVTFGTSEPDTNYRISVSGNASENFSWASKTTTGFTINSNNPASAATVDWVISR